MDNEKIMARWSKSAPSMAGNMIGKCVISLLERGDDLSIDTLHKEMEAQRKPGDDMTLPIIDAALAIIDRQP